MDLDILDCFGYYFLPFQNNPKYLDLSYRTDLDIWDCLETEKINLKAELHKTNLDIWGHYRNGKAPSYKQGNTVCLIRE